MTEKHLENDTEEAGCEEWRDIQGYEGLYQVSNHGRVRSLDRIGYQKHWQGGLSRYVHKGKVLKARKQRNGYMTVDLRRNGKFERFLIHRLVGSHFLEKPEGKNYINHLDVNPENNRSDNLVWCTQSENIQYAYDNGTKIPPHMRKVAQYDLDGNFIRMWNSQAEIERTLHIFQANITKVCRGKRNQTGGFKWQYIE